MPQELRVFAVDDDSLVLEALDRMLRRRGVPVEGFTTLAAFRDRLPYDGIACLLLDLHMPGLAGLEVQNVTGRKSVSMPVVFLSAWRDVPSTVRAMREGAIDFLVKPVEEELLVDAIGRARVQAVALRAQQRLQRDVEDRFARLTTREREVCELVATGLLNKQIAHELGMSEKTVKVHRGRVRRKLDVDSVAALVRLVSSRPR
jgi:FixJ family two-component response regulator